MRSLSMLSWFLGALFFSSLFDYAAADRGIWTFVSSGVVTIFVVGGTFIFLYTLYYSAAKTGYGGWRNHALWFLLDVWLYMSGIFLIFGPDSLTGLAGVGPSGGVIGPRSCIIGLQLVFQSALGIFAIYSANAYASLVFGIFGIFNTLCLMGSNFLFNYNEPIWLLNSPECYEYFEFTAASNLQRCDDQGYLEFLRIIGSLAIITEGYLVIISLLAYATAVPAYGHPGEYPAGAVGAPVGSPAAGYPATGYPATGYPAGTYGTTTAATTTTTAPTTYATTTTQPYATTTTTHATAVP